MSTRVAVAVITFRRPALLHALLTSLQAQELPEDSDYAIRIVVVDNDAEGNAARVIDEFGAGTPYPIESVVEPEPGIPFAREKSVELFWNDDALIFVDDDEVAPPGWLANLLKAWESTGADVVTGPVKGDLPPGAPPWNYYSDVHDSTGRHTTGEELRKAYTNNTLVSRRVYHAVTPGFHPAFRYTGSSDLHFFLRVHRAGFRIVWCEERALYRALLRRHRITRVYVVVAYFHQHIVGAARDLGIRVVELQRGAISPYHLGYSYPGRPVVADQPDELWCFGSYWTSVADLPAGMKTAVVGAPFLPTAGAKDPHRVVFLSQGTIGAELLHVAESVAKEHPGLEVLFRLHPSERAADYTIPAGVQLSTGGSTLDLLASATYQVGVSTTALFEGMALGCRTAVANLPGHEYLEPAIARGHALLMTRPSQLTSAPLCTDPAAYYAPTNLRSLL